MTTPIRSRLIEASTLIERAIDSVRERHYLLAREDVRQAVHVLRGADDMLDARIAMIEGRGPT